MASEVSSKTKIGAVIAVFGGLVGAGIVIYALLGARTEQVDLVTGDAGADAVEVEPEAPSAEPEAMAADGTDGGSDEVSAPEAEQVVTGDADNAGGTQAATEDAEGSEVGEAATAPDADTDVASVDLPETDAGTTLGSDPDSGAQTDPAPQSDDAPAVVSDAPVVETDDPVMPSADPVVLQTVPTPGESAEQLPADDPSVPRFDLVRIEADGSAVIAGRAAPNAQVQILSNGSEIGTVTASSKGEFVALLDTPVTTTAQSLALIAEAPEGGTVASQSNVIVLARSASELDGLDEEISLAPAIVQAAPDAVRVLQPVVGLADLDRVSLDTISYDQAGQVILAGRGRPGFVARIYADGDALFESEISRSGTWSATINELDAGRYTVRVDEIDPSGAVASRVESPFQRIFPSSEQLALLTDAASVIVQPGNNLWTIAERRYGEGFRYTTIFEANKEQIRDPDLIYPGQVFELPGSEGE